MNPQIMENTIPQGGYGAVDIPPPGRIRRLNVAGASGDDIPESFVIAPFRHWFDESFRPVRERVHTAEDGTPFSQRQGGLDDCVGRGARLVKTGHEGTAMSARDAWNLAKRIDESWGLALSEYGATLWAGIEALDGGIAEERLVPSTPTDRASYLDMDSYLTAEIEANRELHRGAGRPFYVPRDEMVQTVWRTGQAALTSITWYSGDNSIGLTIGPPTGSLISGHAVVCIGQINRMPLMATFSKDFADCGTFLVPPEQLPRFGNAYFHVDDETADLSELLERYDGKDVQLVGSPDYYRCELAVLRKYPDEVVWWSFGKLFGYDTVQISGRDFEAIPKGPDMDIKDAPNRIETNAKELVRQVQQHWEQRLRAELAKHGIRE